MSFVIPTARCSSTQPFVLYAVAEKDMFKLGELKLTLMFDCSGDELSLCTHLVFAFRAVLCSR